MASTLALTATSGAIFGAALRTSGLFDPDLILGQMYFQSYTMLQTFLVATATSSLVLYSLGRIGNPKTPPRSKTSLGSSWSYDGNIIGGLLQGAGMTLAGTCPGMLLVQIAVGVPQSLTVLLGGLLGGIAYTSRSWKLSSSRAAVQGADQKASLWQLLNVVPLSAEIIFQIMAATIVFAAYKGNPRADPTPVPPIYGGMVLGAAQLSSVLLTGNTLGVSGAYEEFAKYFWWALGSVRGKSISRPSYKNIVFAIGVWAGSLALSRSEVLPLFVSYRSLSTYTSLLGGFLMIFGARLAQGCPSGHGLSGVGGLSTASFVTVASMFAGGMSLAYFL